MTMAELATLGGVLVLLVMSALFSGSETALTAVSRARMHSLNKQGDARAKRVTALLARRGKLIASILIGNNLVNILAPSLMTSLLIRLAGDAGVAYATVLMTAVIVVFSEVLPKAYALQNTDRMALNVALPIGVIVRLLSPLAALVQALTDGLFRLFGIDTTHRAGSPVEELRGTVDLHTSEGRMYKHERDMLHGILDLSELTVEDVMVHRRSMVLVDAAQPPAAVVAEVLASPYTRFPVYRENPDDVIGLLHAKDVLRALHELQGDATELDITRLARPAWFVPETTSLREQLNAFRVRRDHLALVVDEYGSIMGLVTLEDIIEEIVGDIAGGQSTSADLIRRQPDGSYVVDGALPIRDLNRHCDWSLPDDEASTVAGLVIHEARHIPQVGEVFQAHGFRFEVLKRQRNQVTAVKVQADPDGNDG